MLFAIAGLCSAALQIIFLPVIIKISCKNQWFDLPNSRKIHTENIPRTGGIGIFITLVLTSFIFILLNRISTEKNLIFVIIGISILFLTGILDDFENLRARYKLVLQIIAALIVIAAGFHFPPLPLPLLFPLQNRIIICGITLFWIVGVTNALNLIDGMDGLASGVTCIAALFWGIISLHTGQIRTAVFAFILAGVGAGFLVFNKPPAKIFMGDSGSLILGYSLAMLPLLEKGTNPPKELLISITILVIPIFDTIAAIFRRIRLKRPIADPDMDHIHHKLIKLNLETSKILLILYAFCIFSGAISLLWTLHPLNVYFLPLTWIPAFILFRSLHRRHWNIPE
jgi:UDP-GlcNAc:undecaprenyl-phosphate GlcNAc-1-phosphate transferase